MLPATLSTRGAQMDHEDVAVVPSVNVATKGGTRKPRRCCRNASWVLAVRKAQEDPGDVISVPSATLVAKGTQTEPDIIAAMSPGTLATTKAQMDHRDVKAVSSENVATKGAQVDPGNASEMPLCFWLPRRQRRILKMSKQCPQWFWLLRGTDGP
jgi:hypothetical protein